GNSPRAGHCRGAQSLCRCLSSPTSATTPPAHRRGAGVKAMQAKLQRRIQRYGWDKAVDSYEPYWQQQLAAAQSRLLAMARLRRGADVLDVACGTGLVTCQAAVRVDSTGMVIGIDISEHMIERARAQAALQHLNHITFDRMQKLRSSSHPLQCWQC